MKRVLITGITGFVGGWLARHCIANGDEVYGTKRWRSNTSLIKDIENDIRLIECDLTDAWAVQKAIKSIDPTHVYHLAAQSYVDASYRNPSQTLEENIVGTTNLLEAIRLSNPKTRFHFASSSEVYGQVLEDEVPVTEKNTLRPASPYAVSKAACDLLCQHYNRAYCMNIVITRSFTHTGPGRGEVFVESSFAKQVAEIEVDKREALSHGNLESVRTWLDVRDIVKLFRLAIDECPPDVYIVGGDNVRTVKEMLEYLCLKSRKYVRAYPDYSRFRPSDVTLQIPNSDPIRKITGWGPEISFEKTMDDLLDFWRARV